MSNTSSPTRASRNHELHLDSNSADGMRGRFEKGWHAFKLHALAAFEKLTREDLDWIKGRHEQLVHRIKERYGYDDAQAEEELSRFVSEGGSTRAIRLTCDIEELSAAGDDHYDPSGPGDPPNPTHMSSSRRSSHEPRPSR